MRVALPIDEALRDPNLLGAALGDTASWETWVTALRASQGLSLNDKQRQIFFAISGGRAPPTAPVKETWAVVGRRGGKSRTAAAIAVDVACLQKHRLAPGEVGYVLVLSATVAQANVVFSYARGFLEQSPVLRQQLIEATRSELRLAGNIVIATHPNSFRSVRGRTLLAVIFDESAIWRDETSANPDLEVYRAVKPALIASGGPLIGISSPYRKLGLLYNRYKDFFGIDNPNVLVVHGPSRLFNPQLNEEEIAAALIDDPEGNISEWEAEFRTDISAFLSDADISACVDTDRPLELPPRNKFAYRGFVDPSGGRHDAFTLAIGHKEIERTIVDVLRGQQPPFDPKAIVSEYAGLLQEYGIREVVGDNYAAAWVEAEFRAAGIRYVRSELPKGRLYVEGLPSFTRRTVALPDHPRLLRELRLLERRAHIGGKDSVDHGRVGSDDYANAVFGLLHHLQKRKRGILVGTYGYGGGPITWRDGASGEEIDPMSAGPIHRTGTLRVVHVSERQSPAVRASKFGWQ